MNKLAILQALLLLASGEAFVIPSIRHRFVQIRNKLQTITSNVLPVRAQLIKRFMTLEDEQMEELLEEMIYSGDFTAFIRKKSKDIISEDFLEYLEERLKSAVDEDDKNVLTEIITLVSDKIKLNDGMSNGEMVFEERLDKILYTSPNKRRVFIEENIEEMTEGFIDHVKKQMSADKDIDNKVVFASILQLISDVKGSDYLGEQASLLTRADSTLGEQFAKNQSPLIVEDADIAEAAKLKVGDRNEQILAGLLFSKNDVLEDVLNNLDYLDDQFVEFLEKKVDTSQDIEERSAFSSLLQTVNYVRDRVKEAQSEGVNEEQTEELTLEQVKQRMRDVQAGKSADVDPATLPPGRAQFKEFQVKKDAKETFNSVVDRFINPPIISMTFEEVAEANYDLCDLKFLEMLKAEADECFAQGANVEGEQYMNIIKAVNNVMVKKIGSAQERLQTILSKGTVPAMESEVVRMCRKNEIDEALILLIEANIKQAIDAGAKGPAEVLKRLRERITVETERKLPDEQRLLRALMRENNSEKRKELLYEAFKPAKSVSEEGSVVTGPPLISPPAFINIVRNLITGFGNVQGNLEINSRAQIIIDEAQVVATDLYGEGMSPREQQKMMFEKNTISVWDLASYEEQAMMSGEDVPWRNDNYDNKNPEDVLGERVKRIGGGGDDGLSGMI